METSRKFRWLVFIYLFISSGFVDTFTKLTNINCKTLDKPFADFKSCRLHVPKRGEIALSLHVRLFQLPVNNVSVNLAFFKKASGYRPFLYNVTVDFCGYMANKKRYPFLNIFHGAFLTKSNINHTCPYNHDIIIQNLILRDDMFGRLPVPAGEYMTKLMVGAYNEWKADVKAYFTIKLNKE
ncbi:uncharacterized protein LOC126760999 [Bactrocera neohumeralis]|uniref:uncharacterized protein LOC120777544 n=1 Tax=Bactrocera tryoni TaxID=59916 RepID=UPI001A992DDC|nr:uncharacterized protein LOC120777544 [Bactrocera tryoni]XP_050332810.1 uncharacterized protein LOC126760999 [Bactrocera neohumeralis]